jgi:hypothetical protein
MSDLLETQDLECSCGMSNQEYENIYGPFRFSLEGCIQIGINVFGLIANSIAMFALFSRRQRRSLFNKTLFILAIFDCTFNVCDTLESIRMLHYDRYTCKEMPVYQHIHLTMVPQILRPLRVYATIASIYTTVVIALERYFAVSKPIMTFVVGDASSWKKMFQKVAPVMFLSFILILPKFFEFQNQKKCFQCSKDRLVEEMDDNFCNDPSDMSLMNSSSFSSNPVEETGLNNTYYKFVPVLQWTNIFENEIYIIGYRNITMNLITYLVPIIMLFLLNLLIYIHLRRRRKSIKGLGTRVIF